MLVTTERLVWVECIRSRIFRDSLQFAPGFCSSPLAASPSCCSRHHCSVLRFFLPLNSHHNSGAAVTRSFRPLCLNSGGTPKFRERRSPKRDRQKRMLWQFQLRAGFSAIGHPLQMHGEGLLRLHRNVDLLVRRTHAGTVLRIECAEGCRDGWPDAYDALLYSGPKQCNPKIAAKEQLRAAHRGRAPGIGRAISLHLLDRRCCIIHGAAPIEGPTISVHLPLQRVSARDRM
jgi:hypothetical protein